MISTYHKDDVVILLKDITGKVTPQNTQEREARIQAGIHYSEMLPIEYEPTVLYMRAYERALAQYAPLTAETVASVAEQIWRRTGKATVLVSLARAGTSIGVLIKRYIMMRYGTEVEHYSISIIRGRGIDKNAINYILKRHPPNTLQFVDGWTGKGAIQEELNKAMIDYPGINPGLAVLSDPAHIAMICGTHTDFLIPSACLNSTVSGLISRTILRNDLIQNDDYHGAVFYRELIKNDRTYEFIETVERCFPNGSVLSIGAKSGEYTGLEEVKRISLKYSISDINLIKPSVGEATRVLLRRVPWKVLVHDLNDNEHLGHIYQLAKEKGVPLEKFPLVNYRACGLIKQIE